MEPLDKGDSAGNTKDRLVMAEREAEAAEMEAEATKRKAEAAEMQTEATKRKAEAAGG